MNVNPIVLSIPIFFILIGMVERFTHPKLYQFWIRIETLKSFHSVLSLFLITPLTTVLITVFRLLTSSFSLPGSILFKKQHGQIQMA